MAKGQDGSQGAGSRRAARGKQAGQVVAILQRKNGATLTEIMDRMNQQRHNVRGGIHGRRDEEGRVNRRILQARGRRTNLPDQ